MNSALEIIDRFKRGPRDIVGIDIGTTATKVVRIRTTGSETTLVGAAILPVVELSSYLNGEEVPSFSLPAKLKARSVAIACTAQSAVVKLLSFPGAFEASNAGKLIGNLGLDDPDRFRIGFKVVIEGQRRQESRILTVAIPEVEAAIPVQLFPSGIPAPNSIEVSGLASMSAFLKTAAEHSDGALGVIEFGATTSTYALFNRGVVALVRRFSFGSNMLLEKVAESLGVDVETAQGIVSDGSFDISSAVSEVMQPLIKQLMVSRDFVERRENCRITQMYVSGGLANSHDSLNSLRQAMDLEVHFWNPFDGLTVAKDAIASDLSGREWQFSAAIGACLATFEET
jgi:Tfp pilus assembly PilM family ATPase